MKLRIGEIASGPQSERGFTKAMVGGERKRRRIRRWFLVIVLVLMLVIDGAFPSSHPRAPLAPEARRIRARIERSELRD